MKKDYIAGLSNINDSFSSEDGWRPKSFKYTFTYGWNPIRWLLGLPIGVRATLVFEKIEEDQEKDASCSE